MLSFVKKITTFSTVPVVGGIATRSLITVPKPNVKYLPIKPMIDDKLVNHDWPTQTTFAITHIAPRATPLEVKNALDHYGDVNKVEFLKSGNAFIGKAIVESASEEDANAIKRAIENHPVKIRNQKIFLYNKLDKFNEKV